MYTCMTISVRNVDAELFKEFQYEAKRRGKNTGEAVNEALRKWLHEHHKPSILDIKPRNLGPGTELLSQQVDEILAEEDPR